MLAGKRARTEPGSQRLLENLNAAPLHTPAEGQRWVMVLRLLFDQR